ncbi:alpha/beta fold hydrolase [Nitriliruptor alkaliphilus]|uniref:alpha/beta fold hydrolase n=1 Tax=Nitriliruptor alkaliphilus TaxID=427918 RepID=UPI0006974759|nr:alpha/beta fold hydrolase [Nitriliruptor alkaliphilus]
MRRLRRSRLVPLALWLTTRTLASVAPALAGHPATLLWFVPWQRRRPRADAWTPVTRHHRLTVDGHHVDVHEAGTGPTVLLVHGWATDAGTWRSMSDALVADGWRVLAVDLPAHGRTPGLRTDAPAQAVVIRGLLERYAVRAVVAHSLGSLATAMAVAGGPTELRRVVLLAPAVRLETALRRFLVELRLPAGVARSLGHRIERRFGTDVWTDVATDRNLADSDLPGLVVHDEEDRRAPLDEARSLVAAWPGADLVVTRGLGHNRLLADPDVVTQVVQHLDGARGDQTGSPVVVRSRRP